MVTLVGLALGLLVISQTTVLLTRLGAERYVGLIMVTVVVRELGPLVTAILVLARAGTSNVVELGTLRALGEVRALESLGIDPIHYLVMPRMIGLAVAETGHFHQRQHLLHAGRNITLGHALLFETIGNIVRHAHMRE